MYAYTQMLAQQKLLVLSKYLRYSVLRGKILGGEYVLVIEQAL